VTGSLALFSANTDCGVRDAERLGGIQCCLFREGVQEFVKLRRRGGGDELCNRFVLSDVEMCSYSDVGGTR